MRLRIVSPLFIVLDTHVDSLRAEDASGMFGVLQGHAAFLTTLTISIVSWRNRMVDGVCAVRGGVLTVGSGSGTDPVTTIDIATREAVVGTDLATLDADVLARFRSEAEDERTERTETVRQQLDAIRRMVGRLQRRTDAGQFR